uniref:HlyD family efflux transporter periplasmic adaptor subunit n=1 Tax=uncultured Caulobacter sp. TaxID=158749 RepID=UPI002611AE08
RRAATGLHALGVREGDTVALLLRNDFAFFEAQQAADEALNAHTKAVLDEQYGLVTQLLNLQGDTNKLRARELAKAQHRDRLLQIRAPVDGTVENLRVRTVGSAVQAAQPLLSIVPRGGPLFVEALVPNAEIGFVRVGQAVQVKVDAYPFTDYGMLHGVITSIGRDSVEGLEEGGRAEASVPSGFKVRVRLQEDALRYGDCSPGSRDCHALRLTPGMRVQAEVRTGRRRIIQYLLSPLMTTGAEAGRER